MIILSLISFSMEFVSERTRDHSFEQRIACLLFEENNTLNWNLRRLQVVILASWVTSFKFGQYLNEWSLGNSKSSKIWWPCAKRIKSHVLSYVNFCEGVSDHWLENIFATGFYFQQKFVMIKNPKFIFSFISLKD